MNSIDTRIYEIIEKGMEGNGLADDEILALYSLDPTSKEAWAVRHAGQELSMQAANGKAEVHAQIGLNGTPCPCNCQFCSFAACNGVRRGKLEMEKEYVVEYAKIYEEQGANLILMLTTAKYDFNKLLDMTQAVREVISPDLPLLINTGDTPYEKWVQLKEAGANGAYHVPRIDEGIVTNIPVQDRLDTIDALKRAGLSLSTCVEPVGPEHTPEKLTEYTRLVIGLGGVSAGIGRRITVPGTMLEKYGEITEMVGSLHVAVYRLATGLDLRLNCAARTAFTAASGANLNWAEVGANPRDLKTKTEDGGAGYNIARAQTILREGGWEILDGPSQGWML